MNLINYTSADWALFGVPLYLSGTSHAQSQMATWNQHTVWFLTHTYNTLLFAFCKSKHNLVKNIIKFQLFTVKSRQTPTVLSYKILPTNCY